MREAGKVTFQRGGGRDYANDPMAVIQDYCADSAEFRDPALPLKEIMFRLLLLRGNEPMNVEEFYAAVPEKRIEGIRVTGSRSRMIAKILGIYFFRCVIEHTRRRPCGL